jgi:hypothetical protein
MHRRLVPLIVAASMLVVLAACGGGKKAAEPAATAVTAAAPTKAATAATKAAAVAPTRAAPAKATEAPAAAKPAPTEAPVATEEADLELTDREAALKDLKSYRASMKLEWSGTRDGKPAAFTWESTEEFTSDPKASHTKFVSSDSTDADRMGSMEIYNFGEQSYIVTTNGEGEMSCTAFSSADNKAAQNLISPSSMGSIRGGKYQGTESVNGVRTKHYRYDEKGAGMFGISRLTGDVYVATDGGYAVKDTATWEGALFGLGDEEKDLGKGSWTWEIRDINQKFEIQPPEGCESAAGDIPVMSDATEKATFGDMISYKTPSKFDVVAKFYETEMARAGWAPEGEGMKTEGFATMGFKRDDQQANIMLSSEGDMTSVLITVQK